MQFTLQPTEHHISEYKYVSIVLPAV